MVQPLTAEQQALLDKYEIKEPAPTALTPEQQALLDKYEIKPPPLSGAQVRKQFLRSSLSPHEVMLHDIGAGMVNPWINMLNLIPNANLSPIQPYNPHAKSTFAGEVAGNIAPFLTGEGAIAATASKIPKIAEGVGLAPSLINKAQHIAGAFMVPSPFRSALVGGGLSAATAPKGQREIQGAIGGLTAGALHGLGYGIGQAWHEIKATPVIKKAVKLFKPPINATLPEDAAKTAGNEIAHSYQDALNKKDKLYNNATFAADMHGIKFSSKDFPNYNRMYAELLENNAVPTIGVKSPDKLVPKQEVPTIMNKLILPPDVAAKVSQSLSSDTVNPSYVHRMRSALLRRGRADSLYSLEYNKLGEALKRDYLEKVGSIKPTLANAYLDANEFYNKKIIGDFGKHPAFRKMRSLIEPSQRFQENPNDLYNLRWHGRRPEMLINNLVPKGKNQGMSLINDFKNDLLNGDTVKAKQIVKDLMFSRYTSPLDGKLTSEEIEMPDYKFNMYNFLDHYSNLTHELKEFLFNKKERNILDTFLVHKEKLKKPNIAISAIKKAATGALSYLTAKHAGFNLPSSLIAGAGGALLARPAESGIDKAAQALLPSNLKELLPKLAPYQPSFNTTRLPAIAGITALHRLGANPNATQ